MFAFVRDITQRKQTEAIMRENEKRYKYMIETMFEGMWVLNNQAVTTFVNPQMAEILGYETLEMTGRPFNDFIDDNSKDNIIKSLFESKKNNKAENVFTFIRKDGKKVFLRFEIFQPDYSDRSSGHVLYATDVTDEIRMEEELKLKDSAIETSINAIAILDLGYSVIYVNESFIKIFGYKNKSDVTGRKVTEFIVFDDGFQTAAAALLENGNVSGEYKGMRPDGTYF